MTCISHSLLRVYNSSVGWLLCKSSISIHRSTTLTCLQFRLVSFVDFSQINISESYLMVFLPSVIILGCKASQCVPNVLVVLLTHLLCFHLTHVEVYSSQGLREPSHDVLTRLRCHHSTAWTRLTTYSVVPRVPVPLVHLQKVVWEFLTLVVPSQASFDVFVLFVGR